MSYSAIGALNNRDIGLADREAAQVGDATCRCDKLLTNSVIYGYAVEIAVDGQLCAVNRNSLRRCFGVCDAQCSDARSGNPIGQYRAAGGCLVRIYQKTLQKDTLRNQTIGIAFYIIDGTSTAGYDKADSLPAILLPYLKRNVCIGGAICVHHRGATMTISSYKSRSKSTSLIGG